MGHLKNYENFINEEFGLFNTDDWIKTGKHIKKKILGTLTDEEAKKIGYEKYVKNHKPRRDFYNKLLSKNEEAAEKYLIFWGRNEGQGIPDWDPVKKEWVEKGVTSHNRF